MFVWSFSCPYKGDGSPILRLAMLLTFAKGRTIANFPFGYFPVLLEGKGYRRRFVFPLPFPRKGRAIARPSAGIFLAGLSLFFVWCVHCIPRYRQNYRQCFV